MSSVIALVVVGTTLWVAFDAKDRDWSGYGFANRPWKWVVGCLLLWIVAFPLYLARRNRAGAGTRGSSPAPRAAFAAASPMHPAGWYQDPFDELRVRYWDGANWGDQIAERRDVPS